MGTKTLAPLQLRANLYTPISFIIEIKSLIILNLSRITKLENSLSKDYLLRVYSMLKVVRGVDILVAREPKVEGFTYQ